MNTDRHDWDREERERLAHLEDQIDAMRRRHVNAPPYELLRAAHADVLPPDLETAVTEHIAASPMSRTLAEGLGDEAPVLSADEQERLFARIMKEALKESAPSTAWGWLRPAFIGAGIVAVASLVWVVSREPGERIDPPETQVVVALPPAAPPFLLPFEKPDVRLGMAALTWRGSTPADTAGNQLLTDLKPGLDAYRQGDYATANRELTALAGRYPGAVEILFYQGVSRLFLGDYAGASTAFEAAGASSDRTFEADIAWYRAVAEQRSGNVVQARARLEAICNRSVRLQPDNGDVARACTALEQLRASANPR